MLSNILNTYKPEGIRVIPTYVCNRNCSFCYQKHKSSTTLSANKLEEIFIELTQRRFVPVYITYQGGEITLIKNRFELFDLGMKYFPQTFRKSVTSNGYGNLDDYKKCKMFGITHFTFSLHKSDSVVEEKLKVLAKDGFYNVRVNCFLDVDNLSNVEYVLRFCIENSIQLTLCEDLKNSVEYNSVETLKKNIEIVRNMETVYFKHQTIARIKEKNFVFWIYRHLDNYDYNNIIIAPNGNVTMVFNDIMECYGDF